MWKRIFNRWTSSSFKHFAVGITRRLLIFVGLSRKVFTWKTSCIDCIGVYLVVYLKLSIRLLKMQVMRNIV